MLRLLLATPIAAAIAAGLFAFMALLVSNDRQQRPQTAQPLHFDMVMLEPESDVQRRQRSVPPQPKTPQPPAEAPLSRPQTANSSPSVTPTSLAELGLDTAIKGLDINTPDLGDIAVSQQALPLYRVEPAYPQRALQRGVQGYVVLSFSIDETGRPTDIQIVEAKPKRVFEREAMRALKKWKYQPRIEAGSAVVQPGQQVKLEFKINQ